MRCTVVLVPVFPGSVISYCQTVGSSVPLSLEVWMLCEIKTTLSHAVQVSDPSMTTI